MAVGRGLGEGTSGEDGEGTAGVGVCWGTGMTITGMEPGPPTWTGEGWLGKSSVIVWQATSAAPATASTASTVVRRIRTPCELEIP